MSILGSNGSVDKIKTIESRLPERLIEGRPWFVYSVVKDDRNDGLKEVPVSVEDNDAGTSFSDPKYHYSYEDAQCHHNMSWGDGVGFYLDKPSDGNTLFVFRLRDCLIDRVPSTFAAFCIDYWKTYTEISESGTDLLFIFTADRWLEETGLQRVFFSIKDENFQAEIFNRDTFIPISGRHVVGTSHGIEYRSRELTSCLSVPPNVLKEEKEEAQKKATRREERDLPVLMDSATFFGSMPSVTNWVIEGVTTRREFSCISGPIKCLKTCTSLEKAISIRTATPFMNRFPVPKSLNVGFITGETNKPAIYSAVQQICLSKGLDPQKVIKQIYWGSKLPKVTKDQHLIKLQEAIKKHQIQYLVLDPWYKMLGGSVEAANMFEVGPLLEQLTDYCLEEGCTLDVVGHNATMRSTYAVPTVDDLAYAGMKQHARQWVLLNHRKAFDQREGLFRLHFVYGGSSGHHKELAVDIRVGELEAHHDKRTWEIEFVDPEPPKETRPKKKVM